MSNLWLPSSTQGYARNKSESKYPQLWEGLGGYWDFPVQGVIPSLGLARDLSGNNNHGTLVGDTHSVPGNGPVLDFDGAGYVDITQASRLPIYSLSQPYSVAFWVRADAPSVSTEVFAEGRTSSQNPFFRMFAFAGDFTKLTLFCRDDNADSVLPITTGTLTVFDNFWHFVVWTDHGGDGKLYVDAVRDGTDFNYSSEIPGAGPVTLNTTSFAALRRSSATGHLTGQISDVKIYNLALKASDINFLFNNPRALVTPRDGIIVKAPEAPPVGDIVVLRRRMEAA